MSRLPGSADAPPSPSQFLSRWSKRKAAAREATTTDPVIPDSQDSLDSAVGPASASPLATDTGLAVADNDLSARGAPAPQDPTADAADDPIPALDSLTPSSDFSRFMRPDVSAEIRKLALRKLFQSPVYNVRDGLDDYDDDYTSFEPLGDTITADMRYHTERLRAEREQAEREQAELAHAERDLEQTPAEQAPLQETAPEQEVAPQPPAEPAAPDSTVAPQPDPGSRLPTAPILADATSPRPMAATGPDTPGDILDGAAPPPRLGKLRRRQDTDQ